MQQESAILLQAYLNGLFGTDKELENDVNNIIKNWVNELKSYENIDEELTGSYLNYIQLLPPVNQCNYPTLRECCSKYQAIQKAYADISKYQRIIAVIDAMDVELGEQTEANYKSRIDAILINLISNFDKEEQELKNQETYFNFVIENNGRVEAAKAQYQEFENVRTESFNIGKQMIKWAIYDDPSQTDIHVKKFGLQNTKAWLKTAIERWSLMLHI